MKFSTGIRRGFVRQGFSLVRILSIGLFAVRVLSRPDFVLIPFRFEESVFSSATSTS